MYLQTHTHCDIFTWLYVSHDSRVVFIKINSDTGIECKLMCECVSVLVNIKRI